MTGTTKKYYSSNTKHPHFYHLYKTNYFFMCQLKNDVHFHCKCLTDLLKDQKL